MMGLDSADFLAGAEADGGPWTGTPFSLDLWQCMLMCLFRLNLVVKLFPQESQLWMAW